MTWNSKGMNDQAIFGSLSDIEKLARIIESKLTDENIGQTIVIKEEYSKDCDYSLELRIKSYGYDPALEDEQLWG